MVITEEILRLNERTSVTSIVVSHDRELAFGIADRIAVIDDGRLLVIGTPDEVRRSTIPLVQQFLSAGVKRATHS